MCVDAVTEEHVLIEWNEEPSHCSTIPLVFLLSNDYSDEARQSRREDRVPTTAKVRSKRLPSLYIPFLTLDLFYY